MSMLTFSDGVTNLSRTDAKEALAKSKSEEVEKELRRLKAGGMPRAAPSSARSQGSTSSPRSMKHSRHSSTTSLAEAGGDSKTTEKEGGPIKVGFIGAGNMATALLKGMISEGLCDPDGCVASAPSSASQERISAEFGVHSTDDNVSVPVICAGGVVFICVKPHIVVHVLEEIAQNCVDADSEEREKILSCVFVSVAAGISTKTMEAVSASYDVPLKIARAMPNTPCMIGQGAGGLCYGRYLLGPAGSPEALLREKVSRLLSAVGSFVEVKESQMDAVTGLSGSGPAFVYLFIEALMDGGVRSGLTRDQATTLATQLVKGAAQMVQEREDHVAALKDAVCSAGGTTIAGVHSLEKNAFRGTVMDAVVAAAGRSRELSLEAETKKEGKKVPTLKARGASIL